MKSRSGTVAVVSVLLFGFLEAPEALGLEQPVPTQPAQLAKLNEKATQVSAHCKREVTVEVDWASARSSDLRRYDASEYCLKALDALQVSCGEKDMRDAVQRSLSKVVCSFGESRMIYLEGEALHYRIHWDDKPKREVFEEFLAERL